MEFGLMADVKKRLNIKRLPSGEEDNMLFCWDVQLKQYEGVNVLFVVNAETNMCAVRTGMTLRDWNRFHEYLIQTVTLLMQKYGVPQDVIDAYFLMAGNNVDLTATHGRSTVSTINRITIDLGFSSRKLKEGTTFQDEISWMANQTPWNKKGEEGYIIPMDRFADEMKIIENVLHEDDDASDDWDDDDDEYGQPPRKSNVIDFFTGQPIEF